MNVLPPEIEDTYPLSPLQEGMLFHTLRDAGVGMYITQAVSRVDGLDPEALRRAWQQVLDRHPILRTAFDWSDPERPRQLVYRWVELRFEIKDWRDQPPGEQRALLADLLEREREEGFRLDSPPLLRVTACRVSGSRWQTINTHHHILLDGWSGGIISGEVAKLYEAECLGEHIALPPAIGFRRYIDWLAAQDLGQAERFWRRQLAGIDGPTPLPADRRLSAVQPGASPAGAWSIDLDAPLCDALDALAKRSRITLSTLVQGAWGILLSRYSGRRTVLFGVLVSGRPPALEGVESIVGMFLNTVPFRVEVDPGQPLDEWLKGLREQQVELAQYEYSPLMLVQQWSGLPRGVALFDSIVARKDTTGQRREGQSRGSRRERAQTTFQQNYALLLNLRARDGIELKITYDTARFDAQDVVRFMHQLARILESIVAEPNRPLGSVDLMDSTERARVLTEWGGGQVAVPRGPLLPELVERQAERAPDAPALVQARKGLTYRELVVAAHRWSAVLSANGATRGALVALAVPRGPELVTAMLAVLHAGAAFLILDLETPQGQRIAVLEDARPDLVVCLDAGCELPRMAQSPRVVTLSDDVPDQVQVRAVPIGATIEDRACVIYPPGDRSEPLGVLVTQRAILARLLCEQVQVQPGEHHCLLAPMHSLAGVLDVFSALANGALLTIGPDALRAPPAESLSLLRRSGAMRTALSRSALRALLALQDATAAVLPDLRHLLCRGRTPDPDLAQRAQQALPQVEITAIYHGREIGDALWRELRDDRGTELMAIGRPLPNVRVQVLDPGANPCPIGVPGELCIAGPGLASAYWRRPEQTAARFVPDPSPNGEGQMFRTGILVRWLPDGRLESFGAMDQQYFVAGRRFSPATIESALLRHAHVREVAVTLTDQGELVAHLVNDGTAVSGDELRRLLSGLLPASLVPRWYRTLDALPLTADGSVDRGALGVQALTEDDVGGAPATHTPLEGELEEQVAAVWAEVLGLGDVGADDSFFELGGHSLNATQVTVRLARILGWGVPLRGIFEAPTVRGFAAWIAANRDGAAAQAPVLTRRGRCQQGGGREAPQSFAQQRLWFLSQLAPGSALYNLPGGIQLAGACNPDALRQALEALVARHESLRTTFDVRNGEPVQLVSPPGPVELPVSDLRGWPAERRHQELARLRRALSSKPFDLIRGPLLRLRLVMLTAQRQVLLYCMHHIITDGWSLNILRRELHQLYDAMASGRPSPLPEPGLQYADFAIWQREWLQGSLIHEQLDYWRGQLADLTRLDLPTDRSRPAVPRYVSANAPVAIDPALGQRLGELARREEATLFMVVLAAFAFLLGEYSGQEDVAVGTPIANRTRPELEGIIGFFVNTLVLRTDLSGRSGFRELLRRVRRTCLDAYANQDLPFERLVEELAPQRDLSMQPLFQVLLVLQNTPIAAEEGQRRRADAPRAGNPDVAGLIYYDLTLSLRETPEGIAGALHYNTDLFDEVTARRMVNQLVALLDAVTKDPDRLLSAELMIPDEERTLLLRGLQAETCPVVRYCIHELFEQTVDRHPNKAALAFEGGRLAYRDLDGRTNHLAHALIAMGVATDRVVAVYLERGPAVIVALLGILKAGGAYLPLDPGLPRERLGMLLADAGVIAVVTSEALAGALPAGDAGPRRLVLPHWDQQPLCERRPALPCSPGQLAYVIFTSGSTGRPKGVAVEHRGLCNTILGQIPRFGITPHSRVLSTIAFSFDASLGEIFRTLLAGATLFLAPSEAVLPGPDLVRLLRDLRITTITMVPSVLRLMPRQVDLPDLDTITVGGESLSAELADEWRWVRRLINGYGPTETAIGATLALDWEPGRRPPIGRPLPNVTLYVVSRDGSLLPPGVPGELYIGGPGVARGYLNRPELTQSQFIPDPFSERPGGRIYRTGDRVRWTADGQLDFLGRMDEQVKLRGYRIEPGEIAAVLRERRDVADAVVVVREREGVDRRLVAYVVPASEAGSPVDAAAELVDEWNLASEVAAVEVKSRTGDPRLNFAGWTSSYDGQPIPPGEMQVWADRTVELIRSQAPADVLEIGSGTGLILFRLAPYCRRYVGVDFAQGLLDQARRNLGILEGSGCRVELLHRRADGLSDLPAGDFDCVVLNSVVQYFPDLDYLVRVLEGALRLLRPGGRIFLGDVRNLRLLEALHASIQLHRSAATALVSGLAARVRRHLDLERELVVDPGLFLRLQRLWPRVTHVQVMPRSWAAGNELVRYRYDAILHVEGGAASAPDCKWVQWRWQEPEAGLDVVRALLAQGPQRLGIKGVPNARTEADARILGVLAGDSPPRTVLDLRQAIAHQPRGVEPESLVALGSGLGYRTELSWLDCDAEGRFDLLYERNGLEGRWIFPLRDPSPDLWPMEGNNPAQAVGQKHLQSQLRDWLFERLPEYMVPSDLVLLDSMPLTSHGKIDRRRLPDPLADSGTGATAVEYVAPSSQAQIALATIWAELLRLPRVGIQDNFFELGGDSILSIQMIARAEAAGIHLTPRDVYQRQNIAELAELADLADQDTACASQQPAP